MNNDLLRAQQEYQPDVDGVTAPASVVVCGGMGGSALPAQMLQFLAISSYMISHRDYGLPVSVPEGAQYIALSYSGDTEETLSFASAALAQGHVLSVIASGGKLLALAKERGLPHVAVPGGLPPREAVLFMTKALLALVGEEHLADDTSFDAAAAESAGTELASHLEGAVPLFYASSRNEPLAGLAKILLNETAKMPAFANTIPELNHNEMQGFGQGPDASYVAVFLRDDSDDERIKHRMDLTEEFLKKDGLRALRVALPHTRRIETFLHAWWLMRASARALAERQGIDPDETPRISAFKRSL